MAVGAAEVAAQILAASPHGLTCRFKICETGAVEFSPHGNPLAATLGDDGSSLALPRVEAVMPISNGVVKPHTKPSPLMICIEGNIGVGKSTVMRALEKRFADRSDVLFLHEPVEEWRAHGFLQRMYGPHTEDCDVEGFQYMALLSLISGLLKALSRDPAPKYIIAERSPWGAHWARPPLPPTGPSHALNCCWRTGNLETFAKVNLSPEKLKMFAFAFGQLAAGIPSMGPDAMDRRFIWLTACGSRHPREGGDAFIASLQKRISDRKRLEEGSITNNYLLRIECAHEAWLREELYMQPIAALNDFPIVLREVIRALEAWME